IEKIPSADGIQLFVRTLFRQYLLRKDARWFREELEADIEMRTTHENQRSILDAIDALESVQIFYLWFCRLREVSERPNLPPEIGAVFGHGRDRVLDIIGAAKRELRLEME